MGATLARWAVRNPHALGVVAIVVGILAALTGDRLPTDLLPRLRSPSVQVLTLHPGMPAELMERDVSSPLQRSIARASALTRHESRSLTGVSVVRGTFAAGTDPQVALSQVAALSLGDASLLPPGTTPPMVMPYEPTTAGPLVLVTLSSAVLDEGELHQLADRELRSALQDIEGVIAPAVHGGRPRRVVFHLDRSQLEVRGLTPLDVVAALRRFHVLVPMGSARLGDMDYQVHARGLVRDVADLNRLPVRVDRDGTTVHLRDIGRAEDAGLDQTNVVRVDGRRQIYIPVFRQPGTSAVQTVSRIQERLAAIRDLMPPDVELRMVMDETLFIREAIGVLLLEAVLGAVLAALMVWLLLRSWRAMVITVAVVPLAGLSACLLLSFTGHTLDAMTVGGLALAVGLVIDHAIVVLENIVRRREQGLPLQRAVVEGTSEVAGPVVTITASVLVVMLPVLSMHGVVGDLFLPFALALSLALVASALAALTVVPSLAARLLPAVVAPLVAPADRAVDSSEPVPAMAWTVRGQGRLREGYLRLLISLMQRRLLLASVAVILLLGSALLAWQYLEAEMFPRIDDGRFTVRMRAPTGTRIERTEELVAEVEDEVASLLSRGALQTVISDIGVLNDWPAAFSPNSGPMDAFIAVELAPDHRGQLLQHVRLLREELPRRFPGVELTFETSGMLARAFRDGQPSPINVQLRVANARSLAPARDLALELVERLRAVPGTADVRLAQRLDYPQLVIELDRQKVVALGLSVEKVARNAVTALSSSIDLPGAFWLDPRSGDRHRIAARFSGEETASLEALEAIPVSALSSGEAVLLKTVAEIRRTAAPAETRLVNGERVLDVLCDVRDGDLLGVGRAVEALVAELGAKAPPGCRLELAGEIVAMRTAFAALGRGLALAILGVYLMLVVHFRSFTLPLAMVLMVPFGLAGVALALLVTGTGLSVPALMGVIMVVGISIAFGVLMVDFAEQAMVGQDASPWEAAMNAAAARLRPVLMTTGAVLLALLPMAVADGVNAPLARAVIGGLLFQMAMVLLVLPVVYEALRRRFLPVGVAPLLVEGVTFVENRPPPSGTARGAQAGRVSTILLVVLGVLAASVPHVAAAQGEAEAAAPARAVVVVRAKQRDMARRLLVSADLQAWEEVDLHAKVSGYVREVLFDRGDRVTKGQVLVVVSSPEVEADLVRARAEVAVADAGVEVAEAERAQAASEATLAATLSGRARARHEKGLVTSEEVQEMRARATASQKAYEAASAKVRAATARVAVARADLARCQARIGYLEVRAPFDGVVVSRAVATGSFVRSADEAGAGPVGHLVSDERLRVVFDVPAQDALMLSAGSGDAEDASRGNRVRIHLGSSGGTLEGQVSRIAGSLDRRSRTVRCEVDVSNGDRRLRPGMFVRVEVELELRSDVLSVPVRALVHDRRRSHVFVVREGHARLVAIEVGIDDGQWVEVIDGLARGEPVVVAGQDGLRDGAKVDPSLSPQDKAGDGATDQPR